jgi:uncharacterized protein YjdB
VSIYKKILLNNTNVNASHPGILDYYTVESEESENYYYCPEDIYVNKNDNGVGDILGVHLSESFPSLTQASDKRAGIYWEFEIEGTSTYFYSRLNFWARSDLPEGQEFVIRAYDKIGYIFGAPFVVNKEWTLYRLGVYGLKPGLYRLYITPPTTSYDESIPLLIGNNTSFTYYDEETSGNDGSFTSPYTYEDGSLTWGLREDGTYSPKFSLNEFDTGIRPKKDKFVLIDGNYYLIKDNEGYLYNSGIQRFINELDEPYLRFFYPNGVMAVDDDFMIDNIHCTVNGNGVVYIEGSLLTELNVSIPGFEVGTEVFSMSKDTEFDIEVSFDKMYPPISKVDIEFDNSILTSTGANNSETKQDELGSYNTSITIPFKATALGKTAVTVSYKNFDGTIVKKIIAIYVTSVASLGRYIRIYIPYEFDYMKIGETKKVLYGIEPFQVYERPIIWSSSDETIATVDAIGNITALTEGTCTITATNPQANKSASFTLNVVKPLNLEKPKTIKLEATKFNIDIGGIVRAKVTEVKCSLYGTVDTPQTVTWKSSNESIATVDELGYITGVAQGTTTIICKAGSVSTSITVNVSNEIVVNPLTIELDKDNVPFMLGDDSAGEKLKPIFYPNNTTQKAVCWFMESGESSDIIMSESSTGDTCRVYPNSKATTVQSAKIVCISLFNDNLYAECNITLVRPENFVPNIYASKNNISTYLGATEYVDFKMSSSSYIVPQSTSITFVTMNGGGTYTETYLTEKGISNINDTKNRYYSLQIKGRNVGTTILRFTFKYIITLGTNHAERTTYKDINIAVYRDGVPPEISKDLSVVNTFYNGSYILKYYATDKEDTNEDLKHSIIVDNNTVIGLAPYSHLYNGENYYYVFGEGLEAGNHTAKVTIADTDFNTITTSEVQFRIPDITVDGYKASLISTKEYQYNNYRDELIDNLRTIITETDLLISYTDKQEFKIRYKKFCVAYDALRMVLSTCIDFINDEIWNSQGEMAAIAESLSNGDTSVATYSEGEEEVEIEAITNSNYQTVSDMDYYQNSCIKQLTERLLQLEALVQELINNNDNNN